MKRQFQKLFAVLITLCMAIVMVIGMGSISVAAAEGEGESTLSLSLIGNSTIYLQKGTEYKEFGATAYDTIEGDLTESIVINNPVNKDTVGTYTVSYSVSNTSSQTASANRTVVVYEDVSKETMVYKSWSYSGTTNNFKKIIELNDGGLLAVGTVRQQSNYSSYSNAIVVKYDSDLQEQWAQTFNYSSYDRVVEAIEDGNGNILIFWTNSGQSFLSVVSGDGTILNSRYDIGSGDYYYVKEVSEYRYAICYLGYNKVVYLTLNPDDYTVTKEETTINTVLYYAFVANDNVYSFYGGEVTKENLTTGEVKSVRLLNSDEGRAIYQYNDYLYCCIYYSGTNYFYKLDYELNVIEEYSYTGNSVKDITVNNGRLVALFNDGYFTVLDSDNFDLIIRFYRKNSFYSYDGVMLSDSGSIYCAGTYSSSNYAAIIKRDDIKLFYNGEIYTAQLNENIDYDNGVKISDIFGNAIGTYTCDHTQVDNIKAGNYKVYYTFTVIDGEGIQTYYIGRDVVVEPKTSFENGATYSGSKVIDVEGGSVTINGVPYSYGDVYSIPGVSTMVISGENGYTKSITFTIELIVDGVNDGMAYFTPVTPIISGGTLTLDGEPYISGTTITTKGNHTLSIVGSVNCTITNSNSTYPFKLIDGVYTSTNKQGHSNSTLTFRFNSQRIFSFNYWVSSEGNCDYLTVYKNGSQIIRISGQTSMANYSVNVAAGDYIEFTYSHDGSVATGDDAAYIMVNTGSTTINFTIEPTIIGVADGQTYTESLYPDINGENMTLNGIEYNNEPIENCGNYTLTVTGTNGYVKNINFVIETVISDLINGETYNEEVTPSFTKGSASLNGEEYISGTTIYTPGVNTLVITGENGYSVTYTFTIVLGIENVEDGETYIGELTPIISGGVITLNGAPYTSGTKIDVPGNYTITVLGATGYRRDIHFIVKPYEVNVENGKVYNHSVIPTVSNGTLTLNGETYVSGSVLNVSGDYTLVIVGENGYYESIAFTLVTGANVEDGKHYNDSVILKFVGTATLNGEPVLPDTVIEKVGNYELVLTDGENIYTYNFVIEPDYSIFDGRITSCIIDFKNCTTTLNDENVTERITISEVGNYSITVVGENGYSKTIDFAICAEVNVENGGKYVAGLELNVVGGTIKLNGNSFTNGTILSAVGTYTLTIEGENGHTETIIFDIVPTIEGIANGSVYYGSVTPTIAGGSFTLNGEEYASGTAITEEGVYQLIVSGIGGYTKIINFIVLSENFEIHENGTYMQAMSITRNVCAMEINGVPYVIGTSINSIGKNTLSFIYNGEKTDITFYIFPVISGVEEGQVYTGTVTPAVDWTNLLLDGKVYTSGTAITEVGYHTLTIANLNGYNYEIHFTVTETWENIEADGCYEYSVAPITNNGTLYLDGAAFSSGTTIYTVGHHTIKLVGANGYESEITFTVTERMNNLENGKEYTGNVYPSASYATLYLDGKNYSSGSYIYDVGYHTLRVEGTNGYVSEYEFTILPSISGAQAGSEHYPGNTYVSCSYATIKLNGESYSAGSYIYNVGYYTVEIFGTNDFVYTYEFTIIPSTSGATDGNVYSSYTSFSCSYATLKLNGNDYSSGSRIYDIGYHEIEIIGVGGYTKTICFTRTETINITDGQEYSSSKSISIDYISNFTNTVVTLNGVEIKGSVTLYDIGYHTITFTGANGYTKTYTITRLAGTSVTDGEEVNYSKSVSMDYLSSFTETVVKLDGEILTGSKTIYDIGYHTLTIEGVNGYYVEKNFTIKANWSGVTNGTSYTSTSGTYFRLRSSSSSSSVLSDEYFERIILDGQPFVNNTNIYTIGNHKLEVYGANGYVEVIEFVITPVVNNLYDQATISTKNDSSYPFELSDGIYESINKSNGSSSTFTLTALVDIEFTLKYFVSSESDYDKLVVVKNGTEVITASGTPGWAEQEFTMSAGEVMTISYIKDGSNSSGEDCIRFELVMKSEGVGTKLVPEIYLNNTNTFQDENTYVLLDGQPYALNSTIDVVGYHTLTIYGVGGFEQIYRVSVVPNISGITDDETYVGSVTPTIGRCDLLLDGEAYVSGTTIVAVGYHTLEMIGVNGYVLSYSFTITPANVENYIDNVFYNEVAIDKIKNATLYLDGELYNGEKITLLGHYTIRIEGTNGYEQTFGFSISEKPIIKDINGYKEFENGFTSEYMVNITIPDVELFIDGVAYTSGTDYYTVGLHYLQVVGTNGYEAEYTFTITERINGLVNGGEYSSIKLDCENIVSMKLNGEQVANLTEINLVGNYTLVVSGTNGYTSEYNFTIGLNLKNVENNGVYSSAISPIINAQTVYLDGVPFVSGTAIPNVGYHSMRIEGIGGYVHEISFTINAKIEGVENGMHYQNSVCPSINSDQILLNGFAYESGEVISSVGYHKIKIFGVGGYEFEISFTIDAVIEGVTNNSVYQGAITPTINTDNLKLNGESYDSGTIIDTVGNYVLAVSGENGYKVEIAFTIADNMQGLTNGETYQANVTPTFNDGITVTLDGEAFTSGTPILSNNIGIHKLKIVGVGGYAKEYVFTIIPTIENIEAGGKYQGSVSPVINGGTFKLNGNVITLDNPISTVGNNKLIIHGTNGYVQEISFTLEPVIENLESSYQQSFAPTVIGSGMTLKLNGNSYTNGTTIETVGHNLLVVGGYGGYTKTFTITIVPLVTGVENNSEVFGSVQINVAPNATLTIDGASYTNSAAYTKVGHHTLKITGVNGYEQTLAFTLKEDSSTISAEEYSGAFNLTFNKNNFEILIDGANYSSNTNYYTIGHHELTVVGSNGYTNSYTITVTPVLNGVEDKGEYNEKVTITTNNGKIYIDGVLYSAGTAYKKVGNHTLTMTGADGYEFSLTFTVSPKVTGIANGGSYSNTASWTIPTDCTAKLDGVSVAVNSSTAIIGNHTIEISGANGYTTSIAFTVTETVNITDGEEYDKVITIDIPDCTARLNDLEISDLYELNTPGSYTLTVFGTNGYTSEYKFTVISVLSGITDGQKYDGSVTANTSIGQWYLDDQPYVSGTLITEIGHHTLKVSGPEYEQVCSFTITVDVSAYADNLKKYNYTNTDLELYINGEKYTSGAKFYQVGNHSVEYRGANGYVSSADFTIEYTYNGNSDYKYKDSAVIDIPNAILFVNGTQIENLTEINSMGNNIVTIKGANGYEKTIEIFIAPTLTIENGEVRSEKIAIKKLNATMYLDGVAISGDTIVDAHGTHTLKIEGENGYVEEITFTFDNPNNDYVIMISVLVGLVAAAFVVMIILRKKVL